MEIVKRAKVDEKELKAIDALQPSQQLLIMAMIDEKILSLPKEQAVTTIYEVLKVAEMDSGLTRLDNTDLVGLGFTTYQLIYDSYKSLTVSEFKTACRDGVIEKYGQWYGMCLKSVNLWIKGYVTNELRLKAIKDWNAKIEITERSVPEIDKVMFSKQAILNAFERYKVSGQMPIGSFAYYGILCDLIGVEYKGNKTLITNPAARKRIITECESEIEFELMPEKIKAEARGHLKEAESLMRAIAGEGNTLQNMIKKAFLKHYFDTLIKTGQSLSLGSEDK